MDKAAKIAAAALLAAAIGNVTPAFSVETSAEDFVQGLSHNFSVGDLASVVTKIASLKKLGIEGILVDHQIISVSRLNELLAGVQAGTLSPNGVATGLTVILDGAALVRYIAGDRRFGSADMNVGTGSSFPAGSAG